MPDEHKNTPPRFKKSHNIKTYWNVFINKVTSHTLTRNIHFLTGRIFVYLSHRYRVVESKCAHPVYSISKRIQPSF